MFSKSLTLKDAVTGYIKNSILLGLIPQGLLAATLTWTLTDSLQATEENADAFLQLFRLTLSTIVGYGSYSALRNLIQFFANLEASEIPKSLSEFYHTKKSKAQTVAICLRELINLGLTLNVSVGFIAFGLLGYEQILSVFIDKPELLVNSNSIATALYKVFGNKKIQILLTIPLVPIDGLTFSYIHRCQRQV